MNINAINTFKIQENPTKRTVNKYPNLSPLAKDTVSFRAKPESLIEKFKKLNPSGNYSIKQQDVISIYEYFGFRYTNNNGDHAKYTGPYGETISIVMGAKDADPKLVKNLIDAINRADNYNGYIFHSWGEPTEKDFALWEKLVQEPPKTGGVNRYALEFEKKRALEKDSLKSEEISEKEIKKQTSKLNSLLGDIDFYIGKFCNLKEDFESCFELCKSDGLILDNNSNKNFQKIHSTTTAKLEKMQNELTILKENLETNPLEKEDIEKIALAEETFVDIFKEKPDEKLLELLEEIQLNFSIQAEAKDRAKQHIQDTYNKISAEINNLELHIEEINGNINNPILKRILNKKDYNTLQNLYKKAINRKPEIILDKIEKIKGKLSDQETYLAFDEALKSLDKIIGIWEDINSSYSELINFYEKIIASNPNFSAKNSQSNNAEKNFPDKRFYPEIY